MEDTEEYRQNESNINYKSICCEEIPENFLDKLVAKKHFGKYGKINRFILRPTRRICTVEYDTEEQAERAYMEADNFNGHKFTINYAEYEVAHVQNTEEWVDPEVQAELEAMGQRFAAPLPAFHMRQPSAPTQSQSKLAQSSRSTGKFAPQTMTPAAIGSSISKSSATAELAKVDASVRHELESLLRRSAYTIEEKYRVLDARDKLIRLRTVRQTDINKAVSTKGTCPDMCPEKERLMREYQRQVSCFEMSDDYESETMTISHQRAIKEYSRSSADQEVPLSHDLRPENVLQMTMLYLMHRIMDLCDDPQTSLGDWFHFVWDRTRSIRKDITQQELCSLRSVELVEQCARFHIHCAARLVAEDPSVFDKKINAENLTKCLQSLKYMYHDLRIKNIPCPCEAEFRSYVVLLNLGDANFLWELKQLPVNIQHSGEIKRAVAFYNALQNNNYVRFFDMIRSPETSYLSACILLGYFNKLRLRAMDVIIKSHNWRKNAIFLPVEYLTKVLGFENDDAAINFISCHGLKCDGERFMLARLIKPDMEYSMDRAMELVESKRTVSVGECICGHNLESADIFEQHEPHNSFDANGLLKQEAWTAEDQLRGEAAVGKIVERKRQQQQQQQQQQSKTLQQQTKVAAPTIVTSGDVNIFKVPQASPPLLSKQQQQQQQKFRQQNVLPPSIFGGNQQFGDVKIAATNSSPQEFSGFKLPASTITAPGSNNSQPLFKIPVVATKQQQQSKPTESSASSAFFKSIFTPTAEKPAPPSVPVRANIFGGSSNTNSAATVGGNIFGIAAKETANIFLQQPKPLSKDNVFQHFQTQVSDFGSVGVTPPKLQPTASEWPEKQTHYQQRPQDVDAKKRADAEKRMRELEEEQRINQQQLERERQKLKAMEEEKKKRLEAKAALKRKEEFLRKTEKPMEQLFESLLLAPVSQIAHDELSRYKSLEAHSTKLSQTILAETISEQIEEMANEEYAIMCYDQMILCRYFERWLAHTRRKIRQRSLMESTPIWVTTDSRSQQTEDIKHPMEAENLSMIKRYRHGEPCNFKLLLWKSPGYTAAPKIDIFEIVRQHLVRKHATRGGLLLTRKYFKLLLSLPSEMEEMPGFESLCNKWLKKYVKPAAYESESTEAYICGMEQNVALCVRKLSGVPPLNERGVRVGSGGECDNADGIIFFMSCTQLRNTCKRLHHLLKLTHNYKSLPLAFVVYNSNYDDELRLSDQLQLEQLVQEGIVATCRFYGCSQLKGDFSFRNNMSRALRFVARESSFCNEEADALEMQTLENLMQSCLGDEMWERWYESYTKNPPFNKICSMPQHVIGVYNEALNRLQRIAGKDLQEAPEFPAELKQFVPALEGDISLGLEYFPQDWKNPKRQADIVDLLKKLSLEPFANPVEHHAADADIEDLELMFLNYASRMIPHDDIAATQAAYHAIKALIEQLNRADLQEFVLTTRLQKINYLPVIKTLAFSQINNILQLHATQQLPSELIYNRQTLIDYQEHPWWLNCKSVEAVTCDYGFGADAASSRVQHEIEEAEERAQELEEILKQAEAVSHKAEQNLSELKLKSLNTSANCSATRELDETLYQFDLAKQIGSFDVSFINELTAEMDAELENAAGAANSAYSLPKCRKRKHINDDDTPNEMDAAVTRALSIIQKVESQRDMHECLEKTTKFSFGELI